MSASVRGLSTISWVIVAAELVNSKPIEVPGSLLAKQLSRWCGEATVDWTGSVPAWKAASQSRHLGATLLVQPDEDGAMFQNRWIFGKTVCGLVAMSSWRGWPR